MAIYKTQPLRFSQPDGKIPLPNKKEFIDYYINQNKTRQQLTEIYSVSRGTIDKWCNVFDIKKPIHLSVLLHKDRDFTHTGQYNNNYFIKFPHKKTQKSIFYIIRIYDDIESFYKIGITIVNVKNRYGKKRLPGYNYEIIIETEMSLYEAFLLETYYKENYKHISYKPKRRFGGHTECYIRQPPATHASS